MPLNNCGCGYKAEHVTYICDIVRHNNRNSTNEATSIATTAPVTRVQQMN